MRMILAVAVLLVITFGCTRADPAPILTPTPEPAPKVEPTPTRIPTPRPTPSATPIPTSTLTPVSTPTPTSTPTSRQFAQRLTADGKAFLDEAQLEQAIARFDEALIADSEYEDAYYHRGLARIASGLTVLALGDFTEAILRNAEAKDYWFQRGLAQFELEEHLQAAADFTEAIRLDPRVPDYYYHRGRSYERSRQPRTVEAALALVQQAIDDYTAAIHLDPRVRDYFIERGGAYTVFEESVFMAIDDFTAAIRLDPGDYTGYEEGGHVYRFMREESRETAFPFVDSAESERLALEKALSDYTTATLLEPKVSRLHFTRGLMLRDLGRDTESVVAYNSAEALFSKDPWLFANRGLAHLLLGHQEEAELDFGAAIAAGLTMENVESLIENVKGRR